MTINIEHIDDIYSCNRINNSYCSTALNHLIKIAESEGIPEIHGRLVAFQRKYYENLKIFFIKHSFNIENCVEGKEISIIRTIE